MSSGQRKGGKKGAGLRFADGLPLLELWGGEIGERAGSGLEGIGCGKSARNYVISLKLTQ